MTTPQTRLVSSQCRQYFLESSCYCEKMFERNIVGKKINKYVLQGTRKHNFQLLRKAKGGDVGFSTLGSDF